VSTLYRCDHAGRKRCIGSGCPHFGKHEGGDALPRDCSDWGPCPDGEGVPRNYAKVRCVPTKESR
jgi:hypothetical protein